MKILIIHCAYQFKGGECTVVEEEMKLLQAAGNSVKLLRFSNQGGTAFKLLQLPFNITSYRKAGKILHEFKPDIVHLHNTHFAASPSVIYAVKSKRVPLVVTLHNFRLLCPSATLFFDGHIFLDSLHQNFNWSAIRKGVYQNSKLLTFWLSFSTWLHRHLKTWQLPDKYIVLSAHAKSLFQNSTLKLKIDRLVIKPNFTSQPALHASSPQDHFLFIGRLSKEKGIELLLETFSKLPYTLKIAGEGPYKDEVMSYCKRYSNIVYTGTLSRESINIELQSCTALVFPSIWYEGMPLTIIEAFACGVPVIASKLGAMEDMIMHENNGLHFDPLTENSLSVQVKKWVNLDDKEKKNYRENALKTYRRHYTPERNAEQLLAIYNSVVPAKKEVVADYEMLTFKF
ncbi:MAG: glycosyltransferase family 4 protein [Ferruginibacter sp.]